MRYITKYSLSRSFMKEEFPSILIWTALCLTLVVTLYCCDQVMPFVPVVMAVYVIMLREMYADYKHRKSQ